MPYSPGLGSCAGVIRFVICELDIWHLSVVSVTLVSVVVCRSVHGRHRRHGGHGRHGRHGQQAQKAQRPSGDCNGKGELRGLQHEA